MLTHGAEWITGEFAGFATESLSLAERPPESVHYLIRRQIRMRDMNLRDDT
jgi:hypothetical protein